MEIHLLSGFLGSGKTTAMGQAATILMEDGFAAGVITNDQGIQLVDSAWLRHLHLPVRQVVNGCFCCNYRQLEEHILSLAATATKIVFAESVGSCTDIVATVVKPLLHFHPQAQVTVSCFADVRLLIMMLDTETNVFDAAIQYIYLKQLEEAGIIVVNKIDMIDSGQLVAVQQWLGAKYPGKILIYQNSLDRDCIYAWLQALQQYKTAAALPSLAIDYDLYATGEAKLGWVDQSLEIFSSRGNAMQLAADLINNISKDVKEKAFPVGHMKFMINDTIKISITTTADAPVVLPRQPLSAVTLLINMRIQAAPEQLTTLLNMAFKRIMAQPGCSINIHSAAAFQPGYPRPAYRM